MWVCEESVWSMFVLKLNSAE